MIKLHESVRVARTPHDCYRYLVDFSTCEQWDPGVYRARKLTPGAPRQGSEFEVVVSLFGRHSRLAYAIEHLMPDYRIELRGEGAGVTTHEVISLVDDDRDGTVIDYRADCQLGGTLRLSQTLARPLFKRMGRHAVGGLKNALEIQTEAPTQGWLSYAADRSVIAATPAFTERGYLAMDDKAHSQFMDGRVVAITGATSGIGLSAAAEYARLGATVLLIGRDRARLEAAAAHVEDFAGAERERIRCHEADLLDMAQTATLAERIRAEHPRIDVLVNNAGAMFDTRETTGDGFERSLAINLIAPYVLTEGLIGALIAAQGRVVNMSSGGMYLQPLVLDDLNFDRPSYSGTKAYARAKRGLVELTRHWARRYGDAGVRINAMHPGWVATPGVSDSLPRFAKVMKRFLRDARMGADTAVWLGASSAAAQCNGQFFLDRTPHPTAVLAGTGVRPSEAQSLYAWLRNETGMPSHAFG